MPVWISEYSTLPDCLAGSTSTRDVAVDLVVHSPLFMPAWDIRTRRYRARGAWRSTAVRAHSLWTHPMAEAQYYVRRDGGCANYDSREASIHTSGASTNSVPHQLGRIRILHSPIIDLESR